MGRRIKELNKILKEDLADIIWMRHLDSSDITTLYEALESAYYAGINKTLQIKNNENLHYW